MFFFNVVSPRQAVPSLTVSSRSYGDQCTFNVEKTSTSMKRQAISYAHSNPTSTMDGKRAFVFDAVDGSKSETQAQNILSRSLNHILKDTSDKAKPTFIAYPTLAYSLETSVEFVVRSLFSLLPLPSASVGEVAPEMQAFRADRIQWSAGLGPRFYIFPEKDVFTRFDVVFTNEGMGFYCFIGEAF